MRWVSMPEVQLCICGMSSYFIGAVHQIPNTKAHSKLMAARQALKPG